MCHFFFSHNFDRINSNVFSGNDQFRPREKKTHTVHYENECEIQIDIEWKYVWCDKKRNIVKINNNNNITRSDAIHHISDNNKKKKQNDHM